MLYSIGCRTLCSPKLPCNCFEQYSHVECPCSVCSALALFVAPGLGNVRSHNSQTVAFAHFDSSTVWTAMPLCSGCYLCFPMMRIISCSLRTNPSTNFVAIWLDKDIVKMLVLAIVPFLPQPWRQQAEIWPLLLGKAAPHCLAVGPRNRHCSVHANVDVHIRRE